MGDQLAQSKFRLLPSVVFVVVFDAVVSIDDDDDDVCC